MLNTIGEKWCFACTSQPVFLQRISDAVQKGHGLYHAGRIQRERAVHFYNQMAGVLPIFSTDNTNAQRAWKARKAGFATGKILFWLPHSKSDHVHFVVLMSSAGDLPPLPDQNANWRNARKDPIQIAQYKLTLVDKSKIQMSPRLPPKKLPADGVKRRDTHSYTWKIDDDIYQGMRDNVIHTLKNGKIEQCRELLDEIFMIYGFSAARGQAKKLITMVRSHWPKFGEGPLPMIYTALKYIQRLPDEGKWCRIYKDGSIQKPGESLIEYTIPPKGAPQERKNNSPGYHPNLKDINRVPVYLRNDPSIDLGRWREDLEYRAQKKKEYSEAQTTPTKKMKIETRPSAGDDYYQRADLEHNHGQIRLPGLEVT